MICLLAFSLLAGQDITIKKIRVVSDNNYPPYVFFDSNGNIQGIVYDEWMLWEKITGIEVEFEACDNKQKPLKLKVDLKTRTCELINETHDK